MVDRLERRSVFELDRQLCGVAAAMRRRSCHQIGGVAACALWLLCASMAFGAKTQNVVLIVSDGLRWQEIFAGRRRICSTTRQAAAGYRMRICANAIGGRARASGG